MGELKTSCLRPNLSRSCPGWSASWNACRSLSRLELCALSMAPAPAHRTTIPCSDLRLDFEIFGSAAEPALGLPKGAGAGKYLAQWIMHGAAEINMVGVDPRRFGPFADKEYSLAKAHQDYTYMYVLRLPGEERPAGRPRRTSPLHEKLGRQRGRIYTRPLVGNAPSGFH